MAVRRVFVIWKHPLFYDSVRMLLTHPDVEWAGATSDYVVARNEIVSAKPDAILIEEDEQSPSEETLNFLELTPWGVIIIGLSLANNQLNIYRHEQKAVEQAGDLLHVVLGGLP